MGSKENMGYGTHLYTVNQVAQQLGIDASRVRRLAETRGVGRKLGVQWVFTADEIDNLRERPAGKAGQDLTAKYRRLGIWNDINDKLNDMYAHGMSPTAYDNAMADAQKAYLAQDDAVLMRMLRSLVPDSPRLKESRDD